MNRMHEFNARLARVFVATAALFCLSAGARAADVTFFSYSDIHYGARTSRDDATPITRSPYVEVINHLPGTAYPAAVGGVVGTPRGVIMQGDLINDGALADRYPKQWADYIADFGVNGEGRCTFPVFEGVGNHDVNPNLFVFEQVKARNQVRKELGYIDHISPNGYHYAWDWDGVRFINVNLFPGDVWEGEADSYGRAHDPMYSRAFLIEDLEKFVGDSGRPVVIMQHYRPVDENWWTFSAADKYYRAIQDYNVIAIMVGHQGGGVNNTWRGINWISSNGQLIVCRIEGDTFTAAHRTLQDWGGTFSKKIYHSYADSGLPAVVSNGDWATDVTATGATLSGRIVHEAVSPTELLVYWGPEDGGGRPDAWAHVKSLGVQAKGETVSTTVDGLEPWTPYHYRVAARNSEGTAWAGTSIPFHTAGVLPADWQTRLIGYAQRPGGGANLHRGVFTVRGSGRDIAERGEPIDNFQYAYRALEGDGAITARLTEMEVRSREPKVGVMLRENTENGAKNVALLFNPRMGLRLSSRTAPDGGSTWNAAVDEVTTAPCWLRITRRGNTFTGFRSEDGQTWTQVGEPVTVQMEPTILAGLAVTAGNRDESKLHTSTFDRISVSQGGF